MIVEVVCFVSSESCISNDYVKRGKNTEVRCERSNHKLKAFEQMAEHKNEIIDHPTCRENYTRKMPVKSEKKFTKIS